MKKVLVICLGVLLLMLAACTDTNGRHAAEDSPSPSSVSSASGSSGTPQQAASASPSSAASSGPSSSPSAQPNEPAAREETDAAVSDIIQQLNDLDKLYSQMDDINTSDLG